MKNARTTIARIIALSVLGSACGFAAAADSQTLTVNASVSAVCKFSTVPALNFPAINPATVAAAVPGSTDVTYKCTKGTTPSSVAATVADGVWAMVDPSVTGSSLPFSLSVGSLGAGNGFGGGAAVTVTISGTIALADAQAAMAGTGYTKAVSLAINP